MNVRVPTSFASARLVVCAAFAAFAAFAAMSMAVGCERSSDATASKAAPTAAKDVDRYEAAKRTKARNLEKFRENLMKLHPAAEQLKILEPAEGRVLKHGERVRVVVELPKNFTPRNGVLVNIGINSDTAYGPPYIADLTVPNDLLGESSIAAVAVDPNGAAAAAELKVKIVSSHPLQGLTFSKERMRMFPKKMAREYLPLKGIYADGRRAPVLSEMVTYRVDDPSIATVDDQGFVTAGNFGRTRIHASAGEFTANIELIVEDGD